MGRFRVEHQPSGVGSFLLLGVSMMVGRNGLGENRSGVSGNKMFLFECFDGCKTSPAGHSFSDQGMAARWTKKLGAGDAALMRKGLAALGADAHAPGAAC